MLVDEIKVKLQAGRGGDGKVAFRREKFVELGGPNGANGGNGGSIILVGSKDINTLYYFKYNRIIKAENGENGGSKNQKGSNGKNTYLKVPLGTVIYKDNIKIIEILNDKQEAVICHGGRGGRGNNAFKSNKNQAPDYSEKGLPGESFEFRFELKMVADVGLIGFPNAGKSTILSKLTNANPKIANYEFTTLEPNLGVCVLEDMDFVVCDIPGLIENASCGVGLGFKFLRHIERCRILCHCLDINDDYKKKYNIIKEELRKYSEKLENKKEVICLNKIDLVDQEKINEAKDYFKDKEIILISAYEEKNINNLKYKLKEEIMSIPKDEQIYIYDNLEYLKQTEENLFTVIKIRDHLYQLKGHMIENLFFKVDFNNDTSVKRFAYQLRSLGVDDKLIEMGAKNEDIVKIFDYEFEFII